MRGREEDRGEKQEAKGKGKEGEREQWLIWDRTARAPSVYAGGPMAGEIWIAV